MISRISEEAKFHHRFEYFIEISGIKQKDIAKILDVTDGAVNKWKNGTRFPKDEARLLEIANILNVNIVDLFQNSEENRAKITIEELKNNLDNYIDHIPTVTLPSTIKHIPVTHGYPTMPTNTNKIVMENSMNNLNKIYIDKRMINKTYQDYNLEAVVVVGDSMTPYLNHGDVAIYYPTKTPIGAGKYVLNTPHGIEVKSVTFLSTGDIQLNTENKSFANETIKKEDVDTIEFFGIVVGRILKS